MCQPSCSSPKTNPAPARKGYRHGFPENEKIHSQELPSPSPLLTSTLGCKEHHQDQPLFRNQPRSGNWGTSRSRDCQSPPERFKRKKKSVNHQIFVINYYVQVTLVVKKRHIKKRKKDDFKINIQQKTKHILNNVRQATFKC